MPDRFIACALAVEELPELETFLIVLADHPETPTRQLELQKALTPEEDEHDFDSYCLVLDGGATHYGGLTACTLDGQSLVLRLDHEAADVFGTEAFELTLKLREAQRMTLRSGLQRLFQQDRLAPAQLSLA